MTTAIAVAALMLFVWLLSLIRNDASIVDTFWGLGFVMIALICYGIGGGYQPRRVFITALTVVWGLRLSIYIFWRNKGKGEDYRYRAMRKRIGKWFPIVSLFMVFALQGVLMWIISLPIQATALSHVEARSISFDLPFLRAIGFTASVEPWSLGFTDFLGMLVWFAGFLFESIGDYQLARFKSDPASKGKVMDRGLWRYTRHPNYFGDATLWWGLWLISLSTPLGVWTAISPLIVTGLLMKVSGVALLEKTLTRTKPEYHDYIRRTSSFFPWFPRA